MIKLFKGKKDGKWYVNHNAKNGEILSSSEGLNTRQSAIKNIKAHMKIYGIKLLEYFDETKKVFKTITA